MSLLSVRGLQVSFGGVPAVRGISFDVPEHATVAVVGESGSGKSVTALSVLGLLPRGANVAGEILYRGRDLRRIPQPELRALRSAEIGMVFQEPMSSLNPVFPVGFQAAEPLRQHRGLSRRQARERVLELFAEAGLADPESKLEAYPFQLSGGEQQRVMIAMAIACEPQLLIADEPTSALDVTVQKQILELLSALQRRRRMSVLFITHDLSLARSFAGEVLVMRDGEIRERGATAEVFAAPQDPYTRQLLEDRPRGGRRARAAPSGDVLLEAHGLAKVYERPGGGEVRAVKGADFSLARGETLGLVGESGSGKTTLGMLVTRLQKASGGALRLQGEDAFSLPPLAFKRRLQIVFQNPYASLNPRFSVAEILAEPMRLHGIGADDADRRRLAAALLERVGLTAAALLKYPHEFSGGQRQRIAIARALTLRPELLVCDEAVSALDVTVQAQLLRLLQDLQDEYAMSYLFISHDLAAVRTIADRIMVMKDGEVVEAGPAESVYTAPGHPYTRTLLASVFQ